MLLKRHPPGIDSAPVAAASGLEHLGQSRLAILRWLNANKVDYVVIGAVAHAIRGDLAAQGPVAIVPAPYGRNFDRLTAALTAERAGLRSDRAGLPGADKDGALTVKLTADKLARGRRWMFRVGSYDLDVEGAGSRSAQEPPLSAGPSAPLRYQELLYEANRVELAEGLTVEVASPEDLEHFSHVRRTGTAPEFRVTRNPVADPQPAADADDSDTGASDTEPSSSGSSDT